jgi:hypothetical protein
MIETEQATDVAKGARILQLVKENRVEAMIVAILLYSTGLLEKAVEYGQGVC